MIWNRFKQWWATWWHNDPDRYERMARHAAWREWQHATIVFGGNTIRERYANFKHVIRVNPATFFCQNEIGVWKPQEEFVQFTFPTQPLGACAVWDWFRGGPVGDDVQDFWISDFGGQDIAVVATNNSEHATVIVLKWGLWCN